MDDEYRIEGGVDSIDLYQGADPERVMEFQDRYLMIMKVAERMRSKKGKKFKDVFEEKIRKTKET